MYPRKSTFPPAVWLRYRDVYKRQGERRTARVATYWPPKEIGKREAFRMLNDSTAYVFIGTLTKDCDFERIYDSIKHTKTLIVDMRG